MKRRMDIIEISMIVVICLLVGGLGWLTVALINQLNDPHENDNVGVRTTMILPAGESSILFEDIKSYKKTELGLRIKYSVSYETSYYMTITDEEDQRLFIESYLKWRGE